MVFSIDAKQTFSFTRNIPPSFTRYLLPVSSLVSTASTDSLEMLLQESVGLDSRLFHAVYHVNRPTRLNICDEAPFFFFYIALQEDRRLDIEGLGPVVVRAGQFNLLYAPRFAVLSIHEPGRYYVTLSLQYAISTLEEWTAYFPPLADFLEKVKAGQPAILLQQHRWINTEIQDSLYRLTQTDRRIAGFQTYFDLLVRSLLFQFLQQSLLQQPASPYSNYEIDGIHAARELIRKNIRQHLAIPEISRHVGINEFKLKNGFRKVFGCGLYEYLLTERMREACQLLEIPALSLKEIAGRTGYKNVNSFIKAFKNKFGLTPGHYRRKK